MTTHKTSFKVTENTFESLKAACEEAGTNLSEVCREAGVDRSTLEHWKREEPKTIVSIRKLLKAIDKKKAGK